MPATLGSDAVTSESLGLDIGVASNSSLASSALSSKSLPESGWRASISSLDGLSSKSLSDAGGRNLGRRAQERADPHRRLARAAGAR